MTIKEVWLPFDTELPPSRIVKAGKITCLYETGNLRYIKWENTEIVRIIYSAVRDENWDTVPAILSNETINENENGFTIKYSAHYTKDAIRYRAEFKIEGTKEDTIVFSMRGEALSEFKRNRIGLCMHHPIKECTGKEVTIIQPDGSSYRSAFPGHISPHQPFLNVHQMEWSAGNGLLVNIKFDGEIFETEDQRNWTDSSYKTYGTPLTQPFPKQVNVGEKTEQRITVHIAGNSSRQNKLSPVIREERIPFPKIGYCRSERKELLPEKEITLLRQIPFDHYRMELKIGEFSWLEKLLVAAKEAGLLHTKLELIAFFPDTYQKALDPFVEALQPVSQIISSILVLQENENTTPPGLLSNIYQRIKQKYPLIKIGYGTDTHFAELNRNRHPQAEYDFVSFSMYPQVHATDTSSILENLENQADTITTAKSFSDKKIYVSPVTLNKRNNPDDRQHSSFAAFWTLMCIQNLAEAEQITFYEISGKAGILPGIKPSAVYDVLKMLKDFKPERIIRKYSDKVLLMEDFTVENVKGDLLVFKLGSPMTGRKTMR